MTNGTLKSPKTLRELKEQRIRLLVIGILVVAVAVFVITGAAGKAYYSLFPTPTPDPAAQAVEDGVNAYANFDPAVYEIWLENICSVSTEVTCKAMQVTYGPKMKKEAETTNTVSTVTDVKAIMMVDENESEVTGHQQFWAVSYTYNNWNGTDSIYHYVTITEVDGVWKFDNFVQIPKKILDEAYGKLLTPLAPTQQP